MTDKKIQTKVKYAGLKPEEKLIFDRTVDDVLERTQKGYYNLGDLQRIQAWIRYGTELADEVFSEPEFQKGESVTRERFQQVLDDITALISKIYDRAGKTPPTMPIAIAWDWKKANEAERILSLATDFLQSDLNDGVYSMLTYPQWEETGVNGYHTEYVAPMHIFPREKHDEEKETCTLVLVSLSGKEIQYEVDINSWFWLPKYTDIFPDDGDISEWNEQVRGKKRLDNDCLFVKGVNWAGGGGWYEPGGTYYIYAINRAQVQKALNECNFEISEDGMHIKVSGIPELIRRQFSSTRGRLEYIGFSIKFFRTQKNGKWSGEQRQTVVATGYSWKGTRKVRTSFRNRSVNIDFPQRRMNGHGDVVYPVAERTEFSGGLGDYVRKWGYGDYIYGHFEKYSFHDEFDEDINPLPYIAMGAFLQNKRDVAEWYGNNNRYAWGHYPQKIVGWQLMTGSGAEIGILGARKFLNFWDIFENIPKDNY